MTAAGLLLPSCLKSDMDDYEVWRDQNDTYLDTVNTTGYERYVPDWAPNHFIYMKWHNDRKLTASNLVPISTSTTKVKYELYDIEGTALDNSYKSNGDSLYTSVVNNNIVGFQAALTNMHVGDSVTVIMPYNAAYGNQMHGSVRPYTNLIYNIKLVSIPDYEKPSGN